MIFQVLFCFTSFLFISSYSTNKFLNDDDPIKLGPCTAKLADGSVIDLSELIILFGC